MDHEVCAAFGIYKVIGFVVRLLKKICHQILVELLTFGVVGPVQQLGEILLELLDLRPVWLDL